MKREMIEIGSTIRVENGPARKMAIATKELLDDKVTAGHYQEGKYDALGERIWLGKAMTYLDYYGPWVWYIYKRGPERWEPAGVEATREAAIKLAKNERKKNLFVRVFRRIF
jgi:hypothetical protein